MGHVTWITYEWWDPLQGQLTPSPLLFSDSHILTLSNFSGGIYRFIKDLLALELSSPTLPTLPYPSGISSPLCPEAWEKALSSIPDKAFTAFLMRGITQGFRIGVNEGAPVKPARRNLKSAYEQPEIVTAYIRREVELGRLTPILPVQSLTPPLMQVSPFGVIPKKHTPGKFRLIVDLSSPEGFSVNDAIEKDLCTVTYTSVDHAVGIVQSLGQGCLLAKLDLKEAYRAVHAMNMIQTPFVYARGSVSSTIMISTGKCTNQPTPYISIGVPPTAKWFQNAKVQ